MKDTIRNVFQAVTQAFAGGADFESASASFAEVEARLAYKHRVTVQVPRSDDGRRFVVYSRVASDAALLDLHEACTTDFDAFEVAEPGEVLNLLVDDGYHRIHASPLPAGTKQGWLGTRGILLAIPKDPESGVLLFEGNVHSDVGLA